MGKAKPASFRADVKELIPVNFIRILGKCYASGIEIYSTFVTLVPDLV
jgi:hypothetical protein